MTRAIPLIYISICIICPFMYAPYYEFTFWGNIFSSDWFIRDLTYTFGLILAPCIALEVDTVVRKRAALWFIAEGGLQLLSLLKDNNKYDLLTTVFQSLFLFVAIIYTYGWHKLGKD